MTKTNNIASFVLRFTQELWEDMYGEPHVRWRGHIRHVQGDEEDRFTDFAEAITFMQRYLTQLTLETLSGGKNMSQEKVFRESFNLWEQLASSYADMMTKAIEQNVRQSEAFKEQVDEIRDQMLRAWQLPGQSSQSELLEVIEKLQTQVKNLSSRVESLEGALRQAETSAKVEEI